MFFPEAQAQTKMALVSDGVKPAPKTVVSWFEFLFDTTGEVLKKHLEAKNTGSLHSL